MDCVDFKRFCVNGLSEKQLCIFWLLFYYPHTFVSVVAVLGILICRTRKSSCKTETENVEYTLKTQTQFHECSVRVRHMYE